MNIKKLGMFVVFFMLSLTINTASCTEGDSPIFLHYNERVPYLITTPDGVVGLTASQAALVFKKAGIPFKWKKTPSKRQMIVLKNNENCDCLVGWFKNPDREKFAKFTYYIYQDKPQIALARYDNDNIQNGASIDSLLSNPELTLLVKDGYSYGTFLDTKIIQHKTAVHRVIIENTTMLKMIHINRADYFFIAPEEANELIESSGLPKKDFKYITFSDMPDGEKRYILCSQKVSDEVIEKLNNAINKYVLKK